MEGESILISEEARIFLVVAQYCNLAVCVSILDSHHLSDLCGRQLERRKAPPSTTGPDRHSLLHEFCLPSNK